MMLLRVNFNSKLSNLVAEYLTTLKKNILLVYIFTFFFPFTLFASNVMPVNAATIDNDKLIQKITKDYTSKFCNSLAFGLSKESAMAFSNKENNLIFKKKKGFDQIDTEIIANKISISVVENCGYLINLKGEVGVKEFEKDYISMHN